MLIHPYVRYLSITSIIRAKKINTPGLCQMANEYTFTELFSSYVQFLAIRSSAYISLPDRTTIHSSWVLESTEPSENEWLLASEPVEVIKPRSKELSVGASCPSTPGLPYYFTRAWGFYRASHHWTIRPSTKPRTWVYFVNMASRKLASKMFKTSDEVW